MTINKIPNQIIWLTITLLIFQIYSWIYNKSKRHPLLNPVLTSIITLVLLLYFFNVDYKVYFSSVNFIHFLLGPATVALAIPLYKEVEIIKKNFYPIIIALLIGSCFAVISAISIAWALGADNLILLSLAPKSVTMPIAMGISEKIGGIPSLTAITVILTGITGAVLGDTVLNLVKVKDEMSRGVAFGIASHGVGTAHAFQKGAVIGTFSALAMAMNGLFTALLLPLFC